MHDDNHQWGEPGFYFGWDKNRMQKRRITFKFDTLGGYLTNQEIISIWV